MFEMGERPRTIVIFLDLSSSSLVNNDMSVVSSAYSDVSDEESLSSVRQMCLVHTTDPCILSQEAIQ